MAGVTWTNNQITFTKDLVFGLCVLTQHGWTAWKDLDDKDKELCRRAIDNNPSFPWYDLTT